MIVFTGVREGCWLDWALLLCRHLHEKKRILNKVLVEPQASTIALEMNFWLFHLMSHRENTA